MKKKSDMDRRKDGKKVTWEEENKEKMTRKEENKEKNDV